MSGISTSWIIRTTFFWSRTILFNAFSERKKKAWSLIHCNPYRSVFFFLSLSLFSRVKTWISGIQNWFSWTDGWFRSQQWRFLLLSYWVAIFVEMMFPCFAAIFRDIPFEQAPVDKIHIWSMCDDVGAKWRDLGTVLKLESAFTALFRSQFLFKWCLLVFQLPLVVYHLNRLLSLISSCG